MRAGDFFMRCHLFPTFTLKDFGFYSGEGCVACDILLGLRQERYHRTVIASHPES